MDRIALTKQPSEHSLANIRLQRTGPNMAAMQNAAWIAQALLGAILGYLIGDRVVTTNLAILEPHGRVTLVKVEVRFFGLSVNEKTGFVNTEDGPWDLHQPRRHLLSDSQVAWVYGTMVGSSFVGMVVALAIGFLLVRKTKGVNAV
jgi:F0F1-type ATP synthase assembly protein I